MAITIDGTNGIGNATWTTGTRPSSPTQGLLGYNTTILGLEVYSGGQWIPINSSFLITYLIVGGGGGGSGGATSYAIGGGGGGGGVLSGTFTASASTTYTFTIGAAGAAGAANVSGAGGVGGSSTAWWRWCI